MITQFKRGNIIYDRKSKRKGKFVSYNRDNKTATIEFIVDFNRETGERTTILENVYVKNLTLYRKPKPKKYNPNEMYWMVREFHKAFDHPAPDKPTMLTKERVQKRNSWMEEECREMYQAETLEDQVDAAIDKLYFAIGDLVELGVKPFNLFKIVQEANMGKLWEDGKPRYKEDGKIKKPPYWEEKYAPEKKLKAEIERQLN